MAAWIRTKIHIFLRGHISFYEKDNPGVYLMVFYGIVWYLMVFFGILWYLWHFMVFYDQFTGIRKKNLKILVA